MEKVRKGIIQYVSPGLLIASEGRTLYRSRDGGKSWSKWLALPISIGQQLMSLNRWTSRLFRNEIHHILKVQDDQFACFAFGKIYIIYAQKGTAEVIGTIKGSRPLVVCSDGSAIFYGEYKSNEARSRVLLHAYSLSEHQWSTFCAFDDIRHIHGVFWDDYSQSLWVTTGDLDHESAIWQIRDGEPQPMVEGSQQARAVDLLFTEEAVFYATDAPHDPNYIYRYDRETGQTEQLQQVGGPVFYGRKTGGRLFFSTVAEPSDINRTDAVELWRSGNEGDSWRKLKEFQKDIGHMKLFQYGQLKFPNGPGDGEYIWFTPYATKGDHRIMRIPLDEW